MIIEIIIALILGILAGIFTGLFPGIHINLIAALLISAIASITFLSELSPLVLVIFIVAMAITHTFIDYIPSIFLGAPDEDNFLSILPGHQMLMNGQAYSAVIYTLIGSISAIVITILISPIFIFWLYKFYPYVERIIPYILILASIFLIYFEKKSRILAILIFFLSGFLGIAAFNLPMQQPLLPLFTGLFGVSSLITSILKKEPIPKQRLIKLRNIKIKIKSIFKPIFASLLAAPMVSFLPGLGAGQAAVIGSEVTGDLNQKEFLILLGAINTIVMGLSFVALYAIGKARTGAAIAISQIIKLEISDLFYILGAILIAGIASVFITIFLAKKIAINIHKVNYKYLSYTIISILIILTLAFTQIYGLIILGVSTALGLTCIRFGIRRTHLMGALLVPIILIYLI